MPTAHTLLIVDDCAEDREIYREYLSCDPHCSYEFLEAPLAEVGLDLFNEQRCDAVLLDFWMPDMTGLEFLGELQTHQLKGRPPIIMLTGQGNEAIAVKAMKQGIQDYLVKQHLQPEVLQLAVRNVIQQSHLHSLLNKTRERQRLIAMTALRIRQSLDVDQVLSTVVAEVQHLLECSHVAVYQCCPDHHIEIRAELGTRCTKPVLGPDGSLSTLVCSRRQDYISGAASGSNGDLIAPIAITPRESQSCLWGYLIAHQCPQETPWDPEEQAIVNELAVQLAIAIQQAELLAQTQMALEKAQDLNHFKSQIIATVSHEYRTPLATILASASTLERQGNGLNPSQQKRFLQMIQDKARSMAKLVDDMLVMHQCELNQAKFEPSPMNLLQFLADFVEEHRETAGEKYEFVFKIVGKTNGFWGDQGLLRIAIDNILTNAVKYSPNGGTIELLLRGEDTFVLLSIQDQGIGIPVADQTSLFQSFSRASNVDTISGTGLGLSIAKACIELHSGDISLESKEGEGTRVLVKLPKQPNSSRNLYHPQS
ncbi:ATP-binding protein [Oscillatoria sp. CS-180]|uniref:hybrid sensor histidine kinase/response regulator n=1 Tax=Oscillatoria sp. CS-180 TaxID=3021720 RepID=UPI00232E0E93|nr:ATP-binding protein [Oscillatoria sp. CS-180]MDB9525332.1 ATP-binding protein [Oscillatoria sp. CS-180]